MLKKQRKKHFFVKILIYTLDIRFFSEKKTRYFHKTSRSMHIIEEPYPNSLEFKGKFHRPN